MLTQGFERSGGPAPVLEHLGRGFDEVLDSVCTVEAGIAASANKVVDSVTEF